MEKLNIGCGYRKKEGFINIDRYKKVKPDLVVDIEKGLPFEDNYFDYIYSCNALEEITPAKFDFVLKEINRVAKNNCILELWQGFDNSYNRTRVCNYRTFSWNSFFKCEVGQEHNYTSPIVLRNLLKRPNVFVRLWYNLFPFLKTSVNFKFEIVKGAQDQGGNRNIVCS